MIRKYLSIIISLLLVMISIDANAQCDITNNAFQSGENIVYDLYFNYGILNARAGSGSLTISDSNYKGKSAYKTVMMLNTSGLANSVYAVRDTLTSYIDMNMRPLLFTKEAHEGKDYTKERQSFSYEGENINVRTIRHMNGKERFDQVFTTQECTYDYLSVLSYVRNLDFDGMSSGDRKYIQFLSGRRAVNMYVNYLGTSTIKANDGNRYEVINISMTILDDAFENQTDALKASLTNDSNRIPVVIDTQLKVGAVRAVMKSKQGVRNP
ncbi:MAG: DUF3108 domain-containing protein [Fermentimonas sp.]|jgi:hypothetical protein